MYTSLNETMGKRIPEALANLTDRINRDRIAYEGFEDMQTELGEQRINAFMDTVWEMFRYNIIKTEEYSYICHNVDEICRTYNLFNIGESR